LPGLSKTARTWASAAYWWTRGPEGFTFGTVEKAMGLRGIPETELIFKDCSVPAENVVVKGDGNEGFKKLMYGYNGQRVGASAVALGIAQGAHDLAIEHMKKRRPLAVRFRNSRASNG
jgi:alkylation response protein AidB-like acyl-CoA dehydrogenase